MKPFLFENTILEIPTYYVFYFLAFLVATLLGIQRAQAYRLPAFRAVDLAAVAFISSLVGAKLFHVFFEYPAYYLENPLRAFYYWEGGFVLYGGILFGVFGGYFFLKYLKEPVGRWADVVAPCLLMGISIGRIGCFSTGCCYGRETNWFWGMIFTHARSAAPLFKALHPTQLLEASLTFLAFLFSWFYFKKPPKRKGVVFILTLLVYSSIRFFIEFLRSPEQRGSYLFNQFSTSQVTALLVVFGCVICWRLRKRNFLKKL